jgi:acetylornithine deacetylase/succinyl-diaminopimelate desuccinylase-like protein
LSSPDPAALARLSANPAYNAQLRTTCVATMLEGGHAQNALPQTARALVNCRIMPSEKFDDIKAALIRALADDQIAVKQVGNANPSDPAVIDEELLATIEKTSAEFWPGVPVVPIMSAGRPMASFCATPASRPTATRGSRAMSTTYAPTVKTSASA